MKPLTAGQLSELARAASVPVGYSALGDQPFVVVHLSSLEDVNVDGDRLMQLPCPVLGIGESGHPLAAYCDVIVATEHEAEKLARRIAVNPQAAAVLVQVLRASESLPLESALQVESLAYATLQGGAEHRRWLASRSPPSVAPVESGPAVLIERDAGVLRLTLNRPDNHNAMTVEMRDALIEALELAVIDGDIERIELRGRGRCFSTGGELSEFGTLPDVATAHLVRSLALPGRLLAALNERTTAYVHGACIGSGIEFPAFAGRVIAAPGTHFQLPELELGLIPGAGGCVSIARRIGRQRMAWLVLSGRRLRVRDALKWGLVDEIAN